MSIFNIKTTLGIYPTIQPMKSVLHLIRGASASFSFDFNTRPYTFKDIDQITFMFKQNENIYWFKMFTYLKKTADTVSVIGKNYYTNVQRLDESTYQCSADLVAQPESNPKLAGYYEEVDGNHSWRETEFIFDPRFNYMTDSNNEIITLTLFSSDTLNFEPTPDGTALSYELALRLNTEDQPGFGNQDSILIEPQAPVIVQDSLYSKI
jgi:hypothetical protein